MRWSFRVLTIAGIRIEVHATFLLMVAGLALVSSAKVPASAATRLITPCMLAWQGGFAIDRKSTRLNSSHRT